MLLFCASHRTVVMAVAKSSKNSICQCPAGCGTRWQIGDVTLRLAGGDLGDRAKQPSALSRTPTRALDVTVLTVVAGQVKPMRTTVEQLPLGLRPAHQPAQCPGPNNQEALQRCQMHMSVPPQRHGQF